VQTLLRQASQAVRRFADPGWREAGMALMASKLRELLDAAPAGSDLQLAYVRAFAGVATSGHDLALLAGLLDGSVVIDGLSVDTDLRWALLGRLISRSTGADEAGLPVFGTTEIDAELARDATDVIARRHWHARGQAPGLGTADRRRADHRGLPRHAGRLHRPGPARADEAVPGQVLRGHRRGVA
jgi:aminopeptidase N